MSQENAPALARAQKELTPLVGEIGAYLREQEAIASRLAADIETLKRAAAQELAALQKKIDARSTKVFAFLDENGASVFAAIGKQTLDLPTGTVLLRTDPPSIVPKGRAKLATALDRALDEGLEECIRWTATLNKEYMLERGIPSALDTLLRVARTKRYVIQPTDTGLRVEKAIKRASS